MNTHKQKSMAVINAPSNNSNNSNNNNNNNNNTADGASPLPKAAMPSQPTGRVDSNPIKAAFHTIK